MCIEQCERKDVQMCISFGTNQGVHLKMEKYKSRQLGSARICYKCSLFSFSKLNVFRVIFIRVVWNVFCNIKQKAFPETFEKYCLSYSYNIYVFIVLRYLAL